MANLNKDGTAHQHVNDRDKKLELKEITLEPGVYSDVPEETILSDRRSCCCLPVSIVRKRCGFRVCVGLCVATVFLLGLLVFVLSLFDFVRIVRDPTRRKIGLYHSLDDRNFGLTKVEDRNPTEQELQAFEDFKKRFSKVYHDKDAEKTAFWIFTHRKQVIDAHNRLFEEGKLATKQGIYEWADMEYETLESGRLGTRLHFSRGTRSQAEKDMSTKMIVQQNPMQLVREKARLPRSVDWSDKTLGVLSPIVDQQTCGSCWAWTTAGVIEAAWKIQNGGPLKRLSVQQFLDCDKTNDGCHGGWIEDALDYARDSQALCTDQHYKYKQEGRECGRSCNRRLLAEKCAFSPGALQKGDIRGYRAVKQRSELEMMRAVAKQPIAIAIVSECESVINYAGGILGPDETQDCAQKMEFKAAQQDQLDPEEREALVDHAVILIGYGIAKYPNGKEVPYWKIKNSWGEQHGEKGYMRIARNVPGTAGSFGILRELEFGFYPIVRELSAKEKRANLIKSKNNRDSPLSKVVSGADETLTSQGYKELDSEIPAADDSFTTRFSTRPRHHRRFRPKLCQERKHRGRKRLKQKRKKIMSFSSQDA